MTRRRQPFRVIEGTPRPRAPGPCVACFVAAAGIVSAVVGLSLVAVWSAWWVRP